ncbi:alpha/beta fold hydrolase [Streptomyces antimicrobicus]|uniref:Alpha/beta hydrolase n=1 Tax=Streptomyces antimicrobicus TaxID=2883108 RepID=A0ABS8B8D2_9ACTN|nr:alpha/beta hydrolase [Streptomyces antimicrobicus]MCB5180881.1 alpha/beta hydrolase [Streptomyces antimicrobicus]
MAAGTIPSTAFRSAYDAVLRRWPDPVDAVELPTPYGRTRINSTGPAAAPPVVLLPGGGATSTVWGPVVAAGLGRTHRVHAVDLVGDPGLSTPSPEAAIRRVPDLVAWLDAVLAGLAPDGSPVTLVGHSYGAWIAAHYAAARVGREGREGREGEREGAGGGGREDQDGREGRDGREGQDGREGLKRLVLLDPTQVFAGFRPAYLLRALPMLLRPTPARIRGFLAWESGGAAAPVDPDWLRLQETTAGFPAVRPVTGPRPDLGSLGRLPVTALFAGRARCHDARRAAHRAAAVLPLGAVVDVLPDATHHTMPQTAAERIAASCD